MTTINKKASERKTSNMSKRMKQAYASKTDLTNTTIENAIEALKSMPGPKFVPQVEITFKLNINATKSDQNVRGAALMPSGLGKLIKIAVFAQGEYNKQAYDVGAEYVIADEESAKDFINGPMDVDMVVATPDIMASMVKWGVSKVIGPKGLMPNAKLGTVTFDIKKCVLDLKKGQANFKNDKAGYIQVGIGKLSASTSDLEQNFKALVSSLEVLKPAAVKSNFIQSIKVSATMLPSITLNHGQYLTVK